MSWQKLAGIGAGFLICAALFLLLWSLWPNHWQSKSLLLPSGEQLELTWTDSVCIGETGRFRLTVISSSPYGDISSSSKTQSIVGQELTSHQIVDARLENSGLVIKPSQEYQQPLLASQPVQLEWTFVASHSGIYQAVVWIYLLHFTEVGGEGSRELVAVIPSPVKVKSLLGIEQYRARWLAVLGMICGGGIFLWIYRKRKKVLDNSSE